MYVCIHEIIRVIIMKIKRKMESVDMDASKVSNKY